MRHYLEYLLNGAASFRILAATVCPFVIASVGWWQFVQPKEQALQVRENHVQQTQQQVLALRRSITALPSSEPLPESAPAVPFSALEVIKLSGGKLVQWQPGARQSLLEICLPWSRVPALFRHLARYSRVKLPVFSLSGAGEWVKIALTLELTDEDH